MEERERTIALPGAKELAGSLLIPTELHGVVIFAHGTGSSRFSPRNQSVASMLNHAGFGALLMDLLTEQEEEAERFTRHFRFDVDMLAERLAVAIVLMQEEFGARIGLFGASTGAAAALISAAIEAKRVQAVVSRGGRPDLAGAALHLVRAPTLLIVGERDAEVTELNEQARRRMTAPVEMKLVAGATHLFEEPGTLEQVAALATGWFEAHLSPKRKSRSA